MNFICSKQARQQNLRGFQAKQQATDIAARRLCTSLTGKDVLLVFGNGAERGCFSKSKGLRGPAKSIFYECVHRKLAKCVLASEFRTSQLGLDGKRVRHGRETRDRILQKYLCTVQGQRPHPPQTPGCRCKCMKRGCKKERVKGNKCQQHYDEEPWVIHGVSIEKSNNRQWNRDVLSSILIALLFLSKVLGRTEIGLWCSSRDLETNADECKSWKEIFGEPLFAKLGVSVKKRRRQV